MLFVTGGMLIRMEIALNHYIKGIDCLNEMDKIQENASWEDIMRFCDDEVIDYMTSNMDNSWDEFFRESHDVLLNVTGILREHEENYRGFIPLYPLPKNVMKAIRMIPLSKIKVVILGQDPYHQPGQAMGLSFSVPDGVKIPPSLRNIFKELTNEYPDRKAPVSGDLTKWVRDGVLLLNTSLTVLQGKPMSHAKYWKPFADSLIKYISSNTSSVIFMLWGEAAKCKKEIISGNGVILDANHPSPLSANRGGWFGCEHFKKANSILKKEGKSEIQWIEI